MAPPQSIGGSTGDSRPWDPPFDPTQPSIPISYPITTLEALASGSYYNSFHYPFNRSSVPLPPSAVALPPRRRILVCHDMKGGYTDDALVQGGDNSDAYAIWHWYLMDVFVYFSHYLVTLPPPCWTNAAHTHGVRVSSSSSFLFGEDGRKICDTLLSTKEAARMYAARLTELATRLGFDGWLVSPGLDLYFPEPGVEDSAGVAGERRFDVYMGIDVFGRAGGALWSNHGEFFRTTLKCYPSTQTLISCPQTGSFEDASYFGGGSLTVKANPEDAYGFFIKIYSGQLLLDDKPVHVKCFVSFVFPHKQTSFPRQCSVRLDENSVFGVILELVSETNAKAYILIEDDSQPPFGAASFEFDKIIKPQQISKKGDSTWTPFCGTFNMTGGYTLTDIYIVGASKDAAVEMEQSPLDPKGGSPSSYRASLGQIRIFNTPTSYPPADAWGIDLSYTSWTATHPDGSRILSVKISWKLEEGDMTSFTRYNVYVEKSMSRGGNSEARPIYLGFATAEHFYVSHLVIPNGVGVVRFIVQVCGVDGSCQELDKSPTLELQPPHSRG
ncbi:hypothetical protein BHM03_00056736 [Ensete ventricosum]|nr:hypothetical protein BHM03_00056736 [Ensete ventricosum]